MATRLGNPYPVGGLPYGDSGNLQALKLKIPKNGWVTQIAVYAGGYVGPTKASIAMWEDGADASNPKLFESAKQDWPDGIGWKYAKFTPVRVTAAGDYFVGFVNDPVNGGMFWYGYSQWSFAVGFPYSGPYFNMSHIQDTVPSVPDSLNSSNAEWVYPPAMYIEQIENRAPLAGTWIGATPSGEISTATPTFEGTLEHEAEEAEYDSTSLVHLQITRGDTGASVYNDTFEPTDEEIRLGRFSRSPITIPFGVPLQARYRHADQFGVWSVDWSPVREFTFDAGPNAPDITSPTGKLNALNGFNYTGTYSHPDGLAAKAIQIEVYNKAGTARLFASGPIAVSVLNGGTWSIPEFHSDLSWGSGYNVRAQFQDTTDTWGRWNVLEPFYTNSLPYSPSKMSPGGGSTTSNAVLSSSVLDPDGDTITQVRLEVVNAATGATVLGYPKVAGSVVNGKWSYNAAPDLTFGNDYKWRVQAYDGYVFGLYSDWETFSYREIPSVNLLHPSLAGVRNMVTRPSAEYATDLAYWTDIGETAGNFIESVNDGDASFGQYAWRGRSDNSLNNAARRSPRIAVNEAKQYMLIGEFKKEDRSLPASASFRYRCFDSVGAFLGAVTPSSNGALSRSDVGTHWADYGGFVFGSGSTETVRWPVGTVSVEIEIVPVDLAVANPASSVRFDAIAMYEMGTVIPVAYLGTAGSWYGYFDGDQVGYRSIGEDFYWEGLPGESASLGINVLQTSLPVLITSYVSPNGSVKQNDRVYIEQWSEITQKWTNVYDSGWSGGARVVIPIPSGILLNEKRYRVQIAAIDSQSPVQMIGYSDWVEFDVRAIGPPELNITDLFGDVEKATVTFRFEQTQQGVDEFGGIEIRIQPEGEPAQIYEKIVDPQRTEVIYPFPISGKPTIYSVRQIQFTDTEDIASRWVSRTLNLDYYPRFFLKDVTDPLNLFVGWTPHPGSIPSRDSQRESHEFVPWGSFAPVHFFNESRYDQGNLSIWLRKDPKISASPQQRYEVLETMDYWRRTLCFLSNAPRIKRFVSAKSFAYSVNELEENVVDIGWTEDNYAEDYYLREETRVGR